MSGQPDKLDIRVQIDWVTKEIVPIGEPTHGGSTY